jgi:hypothetical protein
LTISKIPFYASVLAYLYELSKISAVALTSEPYFADKTLIFTNYLCCEHFSMQVLPVPKRKCAFFLSLAFCVPYSAYIDKYRRQDSTAFLPCSKVLFCFAVYLYYDPEYSHLSLGTYSALRYPHKKEDKNLIGKN